MPQCVVRGVRNILHVPAVCARAVAQAWERSISCSAWSVLSVEPHGKISCPAASRPLNLTCASNRPKQTVYLTPRRQLFAHDVQAYSVQTSGGVAQRTNRRDAREHETVWRCVTATGGSPLSVERRYTPGSLVDVKNRDHKEMVVIPIMMINSTLTPPSSGSVGALYRSHGASVIERDWG